MTFRMGDSISLLSIPVDLDVYAGYTGGTWQTYGSLRTAFPGKKYLAIAVSGSGVGDCLDIESGDATATDVPGWLSRWKPTFNTPKPVLYTYASNVQTVINAAGRPRDQYFVWSAHYTNTPHICGPATCGFPQADGTQWTDHGGIWDESLINDYFYPDPPPDPPPTSEEPDMIIIRRPDGACSTFDGAHKTGVVDTTSLAAYEAAGIKVASVTTAQYDAIPVAT